MKQPGNAPVKTILVLGPIGALSRHVSAALSAGKQFRVRLLTDNQETDEIRQLTAAGADVVVGNPNNYQDLLYAMTGCYGVFGFIYADRGVGDEAGFGHQLILAAKESGKKHVVLHIPDDFGESAQGSARSSFGNTRTQLQQHAGTMGVPLTFVQSALYFEHFLHGFPLQRDAWGDLFFYFPEGETRMAAISMEDFGKVVAGVFAHPWRNVGRVVRAVGAYDTCATYAATIASRLRQRVYYRQIPLATFKRLTLPVSEYLANMFDGQRSGQSDRHRDLAETHALNPEIQSFNAWVIRNRERIRDHIHFICNRKAAA